MSGPLDGVRIIELAGLGPAPFAGMMLADAGADIIRIDRSERATYPPNTEPHVDLMNRGRRSVAVDLKHPDGVGLVLRLVAQADGLMEGFRPGVAERLGMGPDDCLGRNPKLVYGRMTGWGQAGPMASAAGHDIDYIALAGALEPMGRAGERPFPPLNLVGDFGGGGMLLAFGMCAAIISARQTGVGQVVDAAMVDGAAALMTMTYTLMSAGIWKDQRGTNLLDTGAHFYEVYETSDGGYMALGAIEPQFYAELIRLLGLEGEELPDQMDRDAWPQMKERFAALFATRTRAEWESVFEGSDACVAPVLSPSEAPNHPHMRARGTFTEVAGVVQPAPAPRFGVTPGSIRRPPPNPGQDGDEALVDWGLGQAELAELRSSRAIS
ncbi:MAG: CaiB/BaiF CoA-transferase family protein [Acidimicrobiales bacterium]